VEPWSQGVFGFRQPKSSAAARRHHPERFRHAHWEGFRRATESGHTKDGTRIRTTRSLHKNGSKLYVDLSFGLVTNGAGSVIGAVAGVGIAQRALRR
jgi:hypothetical protein